jgi:cyclophilin family peptidyl-prolyl cis-trans isomerase
VRPRAFFEIENDGTPLGRLEFELADDVVPKAAENFMKLCSGDNVSQRTYMGTEIHMISKGFILQGGDVTGQSGKSGHSAFEDQYFEDENFILQHCERGVLSMVNCGIHTNNSQFFVTLGPQPHLDGRNVSIGRVVAGHDVLDALEEVFTVHPGRPLNAVTISSSGVL